MNALSALQTHLPACRAAAAAGIELVVSRFERNRDYPFVDTKLSTLTGEDFAPADDPRTDFRGPSAVFGWIQGRGLEALAGHAGFFSANSALATRCKAMMAAVADRMAAIGAANNGRFVFLCTPAGRPFRIGPDGRREYIDAHDLPPGSSDLFMGKGLAAAGYRLGRADLQRLGAATFRAVTVAVREGKFQSDQISFDPRNPTQPVPGRHGQGAWMLALGGFALFCELYPDNTRWVEDGSAFLRRQLDRHVVAADSGPLRRHDYVEWTDAAGRPWDDGGKVLQDPGHALEFTGLAARFLLRARTRSPGLRELVAVCRETLPAVFLAAFANGFQPRTGGICKTFDLVSRRPVNDDMPWWSLPETMRAAALLLRLAPDHPRRNEIAAAAAACARALFGPYRSPVPGLFIQTRDAAGQPVQVVPATPDADPGYHTGLCLLDFIVACEAAGRGGGGGTRP